MSGHDIIVIGASAGGTAALNGLLAPLPADLPAALLVVSHVAAGAPLLLPDVLDAVTALTVEVAVDGLAPVRGHVHVAPPDMHLLLEAQGMRLVRGPTENRHRPAIDPLFRSAAVAYGPRVIGVILSGTLNDGADGLAAIAQCGGLSLVQDPAEALYHDMPVHALAQVAADHCAPVARLATLLNELARQPAPARDAWPVPERLRIEAAFTALEGGMRELRALGEASDYTCPECHGSLRDITNAGPSGYRCHTGHRFTTEALAMAQDEEVEKSLYAAIRAIDECAALARRMAERWDGRFPRERDKSLARAAELESSATVLRRLMVALGRPGAAHERAMAPA